MTTRISTANYFSRNLSLMQDRQISLDRAQRELSTGKKIITPSDDPTGANTVIRLKKELDVSDRYLAAQDSATRFNNVAETQIESMTNTLYRTQELMTQAINGSMDGGALNAIGQEIAARSTEFIGQLNTKNAAGDYIFSGFQTNQVTYELDEFGFAIYQGDNGQRDLLIAPNSYVAANDPANSFVDNLESAYGYYQADSAKLSTGIVTDPVEYRTPAFPATTYQVQFNAAGTGYDILDLGLSGPNQLVQSVPNYVPGDDITVQGITFKTTASNPPAGGEVFNLEPQRSSEISEYRVTFTAPGQYQIEDLSLNKIVSGPNTFAMGDTIEWGGREFPSDPSAALPAAGTTFTFGAPSKNTQWVMDQAAKSTNIAGTNYNARATVAPLRSIDLNTPAGDLLPPNHPAYAAGTTGAMTLPVNTGTAEVLGGSIIYPDENTIGDYRMSFIDTNGSGVPDVVRMDQIDPVTKRLIPQPEGATFETNYTPNEKVVLGGVEFDIAGIPADGDTFEIDRPENSRRTEVMSVLLAEIDQGLITSGNVRSEIGARLNIVENLEQAQFNFREITQASLANIEEVDIYEAVNNLESSKLALQAAQQSFARIQNLSLFNYI
ncbi:flagellar hook-associated protein FlgL [Psychrosphaera ytuae]|uniref:Flagellar hook-associated protein FlgL n=1 Tax=Psychrosphaera ytuae TaxID=2820710 RepID=A0A975HK02_9GAMM|nr:flagellar hook-associated protein FlgL [Psychrosphaera ytuae]QTH63794.1 flagellar hook-associated protein FlgL [Psychrosphaera ytuae]